MKLSDFAINKDHFRIAGFREEMLFKSRLRPFLFENYKIPGEFRPFFSIFKLKLLLLDERLEKYHTKTPIEDEIKTILSDGSDQTLFTIQKRYITTGLRIIEKTPSPEILIDAWCILAEFYHLEGLLLLSEYKLEKIPKSDLCPQCLEPMEDSKDGRYSQICNKCRSENKIQKQRERRGTTIPNIRKCACGCGEIITGNPKRKYKNDTHGRRMQKR